MKKILGLLFVALAITASRPAVVQTQDAEKEFVADEVVIQFRADSTDATRADARNWVSAARRRLLKRTAAGELEVARVPLRSVEQAAALLRMHPAVKYAEPNWIYKHQATSDDPEYTTGVLWGMYGDATTPANQYGSQAGEAWAAGNTGSSSVVVGIIDEGIDLNHPDLAANIWTNPVEAAGIAGVDDDGNGYIDDLHGWDFVNNNNSIYDGTPGDIYTDGHGTHVAGTIGAIGGNVQGVVGVNWNVKIISAKFLGPGGGTLANAIKAVDYITDLKARHHLDVVATNNSWAGGGYSQGLLDAIVRGANAGILFIAAAGNGNLDNDAAPSYPSNYNTTASAGWDAVIGVAAITSTGARAGFSNFGKTSVELGAPGEAILSTTPGNTYSSWSGTSMATPHVTGAAALYASTHSSATALDIRNALLASAVATPTASLNGITVTNGRLNIGQFAGPPPPLPQAPPVPTSLTASATSSSQINLGWVHSSPLETGFEIHRCQGAACTSFALIATAGANAVSFSNTGLAANTLYRYEVRAINSTGPSGFSNIAQATTQAAPAPPAAPTTLTATPGYKGRIDLAWADKSNNETGFKIERCAGSSCTNFVEIAQTGANVSTYPSKGIRFLRYRFRVRAFNAAGNSAYSNIASAVAP